MISATHDGLTVATTTGTEADTQHAVGVPEAQIASGSSPDATPESAAPAESLPAAAADAPPASAAEAVPAETPDEPQAETPQKRDRYQSRIDRLTWERLQAEQRASQLEAELAALRARPAPAETPPADKPRVDQFDTYEAFIEATATWAASQAEQKARQAVTDLEARIDAERSARARAETAAQYQDRVEAARSALPDFDAIVNQDLPISQPMRDEILSNPLGPQLAYWLGSHPDECERLSQLPPRAVLIELGKVLAQVDRVPPGSRPSAAPRTQAPPPIRPVGGGATVATVPLDQADFQTYKRIRDQQETEWRRSRL